MNAVLRRRLEMAVRVRDFLRAHRTDGVGDEKALGSFEELVDRAEALAAQQRAGVVAARSSTVQREELRRSLHTTLLRYIAAVGQVAAKENLELVSQFVPPSSGTSQQSFVTTARGILEKATAHKDLLVSRGMSDKLLEALAAALDQYEQTLEATRAGRRDHVGASADLKAVGVEIAEQVKVLDGLVRFRFGDNPELMGAWASARNVLGPFRSKPEPGAGETPGAAGPGVVEPAA
jgi:hypothetical protein